MKPLSLLRYFLSKRTRAPVSLVHFVTHRCNARCAHCFVDRSQPMYSGQELSLNEIKQVAASMRGRVYHVSLAGGEPTLREDLLDIAEAYALGAHVRSMLIVSNGSRPDALARTAAEMLDAHPRLDLIVSLSVDEIGEAHDASRRLPGLFENVLESYERLARLRDRGLSLNANLTLTRHNQGRAVEILRDAAKRMPNASFSLTAVRGRPADAEAAAIDAQKYEEAQDFLQQCRAQGGMPAVYENFSFGCRILNARKDVLREEVKRVLRGQAPRGACYAAKLTGVLMADGTVYPCELLDRPLGEVRDFSCNFPALWRSAQAESVRRGIRVAECACTYECAWGVNVLFGLNYLPRLLAALVARGLER